MVYEYKWKVDKYPVSAETAANEIEDIVKQEGEATAENVLDRSRPEEAVLHPCFEWNDGVAAEKWRLKQSSELIGNIVRVSVADGNENSGEEPKAVRAFVNKKDKFEDGIRTKAAYVSIDTALNDKAIYQTVLQNAVRELICFQEKHKALEELNGVFAAIDAVRAYAG